MNYFLKLFKKLFISCNLFNFTKNIFVIHANVFRPQFLNNNQINSCCKMTNFIPISVAIPIPIGKENLDNFIFKKNKKSVAYSCRKPPLCSNCKHFIPFKTYFSFDKDEYGTGFGLCKMFGSKFDVIRYSFAKYCRENENQCGKDGYLYEEICDNNDSNKHIQHYEHEDKDENKKNKDKDNDEDKVNENDEDDLKQKFKENKNSINYIIFQSEEKEKEFVNNDKMNFKDLKNVNINSQIYEYTRFLNSKDRHRNDYI